MGKMRTHIKVHRARMNMTQKDLADAVDVRRETIVHLEQERYIPSLELAYRIARVFGVAVEELFEFEET
jgi:putative transcriptional regulator